MFSNKNKFYKKKKKAVGTHLKLTDSLAKPVILYESKCWGNFQKKSFLLTKSSNSTCQCASKY